MAPFLQNYMSHSLLEGNKYCSCTICEDRDRDLLTSLNVKSLFTIATKIGHMQSLKHNLGGVICFSRRGWLNTLSSRHVNFALVV